MADIEHAKSCSELNVSQNFGQTAQVVLSKPCFKNE